MRNMIPSSFCIAMTLALGACAQPTPSDAATPMPPTQATASGEMRIETIASGTGLSSSDAAQLAREVRVGLGINENSNIFQRWWAQITN